MLLSVDLYEVVMQRRSLWFHPKLQIIFLTQEMQRRKILQNRKEPQEKKKTKLKLKKNVQLNL